MITVKEISKSYGSVKALKNIDLTIKDGETFGLLGPNGAGKTTLINILSAILRPDTGTVVINNRDLIQNKDTCKLQIGVVPQEIALYETLTAYENLRFWGGLYQISTNELEHRIKHILELVGLSDRQNDAIRTYSGGMKRRINIASALLHHPSVLLMDEPTVGVDPQSRNRIFEIVEKLKQDGMTIIYTTHYMEEAERLCDTIAIIDNGSVVANGTLEELKKINTTKDILRIKTAQLTLSNLRVLTESVHLSFAHNANELFFECRNIAAQIPEILNAALNAGIEILGIETQATSLESVFLKLTGNHLRD